MIKLVYSLFLGLLISIFVGFGVATFYPSPKAPEYPTVLQEPSATGKEYTPEQRKADSDYQKKQESYSDRLAVYNRNVSMIVLAAAVALLVASLAMHARLNVLADGLLLGGTLSLLYGLGRGFASQDPKYSFMAVSVAIVVTMVVGYVKFVKPQAHSTSK